MESQIESGVELIVRLRKRPRLPSLEPTLLSNGLGNADTVEIVGEDCTGKTLLVSQLLASCILPAHHGTTRIGGCGASAVLLNTDHHFQNSKLCELMRVKIRRSSAIASFDRAVNLDDETVNRIVRDSLRNLIVYDCYDSEQFWLTVRTLDDVFLSDGNIALLAVDGIDAYYWEERRVGNRPCTLDSYVGKSLRAVREHTSRFKVITIFTWPGSLSGSDRAKRSSVLLAETCGERAERAERAERGESNGSMNYRIRLCKIIDGSIARHEAIVESAHTRSSRSSCSSHSRLDYTMDETGIRWETIGRD